MKLVKWQRNAIFKAIVAGGLGARECTFDYDEGGRITHVPSESYFLLEGDVSEYTATAFVGDNPSWPSTFFTWPNVEERVQRWAEEVKRDVNTPDLWAELQREREILTGARYEAGENTSFTPDEQGEIARQLREIKEYVKTTYSLSRKQMLLVDARFDELEAASSRLGRKDWRLVFLGVLFSLIASVILPPEAVPHILKMALHGLDHLFGSVGGPPQLPPMT